ncbi:MAG TPA: DUF488 domain-containing protein, partial [Gemmataceae bacterium]|nr:DUF488 domain-containing protein [Gemmataceae bacterium]
ILNSKKHHRAADAAPLAMSIQLFTIGFTKKSAEAFFTKLQRAGVKRLIDVRLNNNSQLAGFSKRDDLAYFLKAIAGIDYVHLLDLSPTQELLDRYKKADKDWSAYERDFLKLMADRKIEATLHRDLINDSCLLCSEDQPHHCHRRLVAEYLQARWGNLEIRHLV